MFPIALFFVILSVRATRTKKGYLRNIFFQNKKTLQAEILFSLVFIHSLMK